MMKRIAEINLGTLEVNSCFCDRTDQAKPEAVNIRRQFSRTLYLRFDFYSFILDFRLEI